jgi:hypothetical protein
VKSYDLPYLRRPRTKARLSNIGSELPEKVEDVMQLVW